VDIVVVARVLCVLGWLLPVRFGSRLCCFQEKEFLMSRLKIVVLALVALSIVGTVVAATAFALPEFLNELRVAPENVRFTATSKTTEFSTLRALAPIVCGTSSSRSETEGRGVLGPFHIIFLHCKTGLGGVCTGLGDPNAGEILVLGSFHIVFDKLAGSPSLGAGILFLLAHVHFECREVPIVERVLVLVLGQVLCLIEPINVLQLRAKVRCERSRTEAGDPSEVVYWNDRSEEVNIREGLLGAENEGTSAMSAELTVGPAEIETENREALEIMA
jgi:hypothetical protein